MPSLKFCQNQMSVQTEKKNRKGTIKRRQRSRQRKAHEHAFPYRGKPPQRQRRVVAVSWRSVVAAAVPDKRALYRR